MPRSRRPPATRGFRPSSSRKRIPHARRSRLRSLLRPVSVQRDPRLDLVWIGLVVADGAAQRRLLELRIALAQRLPLLAREQVGLYDLPDVGAVDQRGAPPGGPLGEGH